MTWAIGARYSVLLVVAGVVQSLWLAPGLAIALKLWERRPRDPATRYVVGLAGLALSTVLPAIAVLATHRSMFSDTVALEALGRGETAGGFPQLVGRYGDRVVAAAFAVWLVGAGVGLARLGLGLLALERRIRRASPSARGERLVAEIAGMVPGRLTVRESGWGGSPFVAGSSRPALVLPRWLFADLDREQLVSVVRHELAHLARHDFAVNVCQRVLECLGWCNPALLAMSRRVRAAREEACDEVALAAGSSPLAMAAALIRLEERRTPGPVLASALGGGDELGPRIRRLIAPERRFRATRRLGPSLVGAALVGLLAVGAGVAGDRAGVMVRWTMPVATVRAVDPAGMFSIAMLGGRVLSAWLPTGRPRVVQRGQWAQLVDERGTTVMALRMRVGGFWWEPRSPHP